MGCLRYLPRLIQTLDLCVFGVVGGVYTAKVSVEDRLALDRNQGILNQGRE
jgi:hypothetical protein